MADPKSTAEKPTLLPEGAREVIVVSRGPRPSPPLEMRVVPDVVRMSKAQAVAELRSEGFRPLVTEDCSERHPRGLVINQLPKAGEHLAAGDDIVLLVSLGKSASHCMRTELPDLLGKTEAEALQALKAASLKAQTVRVFSDAEPGRVIAQLPNRETAEELPPRVPRWMAVVAIALVVLAALIFTVWLLR